MKNGRLPDLFDFEQNHLGDLFEETPSLTSDIDINSLVFPESDIVVQYIRYSEYPDYSHLFSDNLNSFGSTHGDLLEEEKSINPLDYQEIMDSLPSSSQINSLDNQDQSDSEHETVSSDQRRGRPRNDLSMSPEDLLAYIKSILLKGIQKIEKCIYSKASLNL